jgi:hypothetical protein
MKETVVKLPFRRSLFSTGLGVQNYKTVAYSG